MKTKDDSGERDEYFLVDPQDFAEYIQLIRDGSASDHHHNEFELRIIQHFIDSVHAGKQPDDFVMTALANALEKVLMGGRWEDEIPLPWTEQNSVFSRAESRKLQIFCDIENYLRANPASPVVETIKIFADTHAVSYETARQAYYSGKQLLSKFPQKT